MRTFATIGLLGALLYWATPSAVAAALASIDPIAWLFAALAILAGTLVGALNLHLLLRDHSRQRFGRFLGSYWIAWAFGLVVPGQVGDMATLTLALKRQGIDWRGTLGRSLVDKSVTLCIMLAFALVALGQVSTRLETHLSWDAPAPALILGASLIIVAILIAVAWLRRKAQAVHDNVRRVADAFTGILRRRPDLLAINVALTVVKTLLIGAAYWLALNSLGQEPIEYWPATTVSMAGGLVAYLPISLNGIGAVEAAGAALFGAYGVAPSTVVTAYLLLRITVMALAWFPAGLIVLASRRAPVSSGG